MGQRKAVGIGIFIIKQTTLKDCIHQETGGQRRIKSRSGKGLTLAKHLSIKLQETKGGPYFALKAVETTRQCDRDQRAPITGSFGPLK